MARTVSEGLNAIANADLKKLDARMADAIAKAKADISAAGAEAAKLTLQQVMDMLEAAKRGR